MARPNFQYEKRQKDLARRKKQEEKLQRKQERREAAAAETSEPVLEEGAPVQERPSPDTSFWPLARLEACEALMLLAVNGLGAGLVSWMMGVPLSRAYDGLWRFLLPFHAAVSWACLMVPLVLVGQSPFMAVLELALDAPQPERRLSFSLFHLVSVVLFPVSFLCMVLTPGHRTLAELLTGQEIVPNGRSRR